ncbi:hypothetical protein HMN09_01248000 [Mycena chlorophos]|uniref:Uncharacterized protein n=1 Tax=Mycena chlorophos TaxID=658473 RepID=A0A8H6VRX4_MYCCL|nr:hypothetical protein HMN09_01248000 [Mycena chlorophos]
MSTTYTLPAPTIPLPAKTTSLPETPSICCRAASAVPLDPSKPLLTLLTAPLTRFTYYTRLERASWLIDIAHDLCDPLRKRGLLYVLLADSWHVVHPGDPLCAAVYLYALPAGVVISISKFSKRHGKSLTSRAGNASTMARQVKKRDNDRCWVAPAGNPVNSHIVPKRMGDALARSIYHQFCGEQPPPALRVHDPIFGFCLSPNLRALWDNYELGFRLIRGSQPVRYEVHSFNVEAEFEHVGFISQWGYVFEQPTQNEILHGREITPPAANTHELPPAGLFRWEYLQCVVKLFKADDYEAALANISFPEQPFRTEDDDDGDECPLWPSAAFDFAALRQAELEEAREAHGRVSQWLESTQ